MLSQSAAQRTFKSNLLLAIVTAFTAGMTNTAGVMACYSFTTNVTGHTAAFAGQMIKGNWFEILVVFMWIFLFLLGAGIAHFLIRSFEYKGPYFANATPLVLEMLLFTAVAFYGIYFTDETARQTEVITGALLLAMGIQNSAVSTISNTGIKTSHLTGLFTDLGAELAEWFHPNTNRPPALRQKLLLRFSILFFYLLGALTGGYCYGIISFGAFYIIAGILLLIILFDLFIQP